MRGGRPAARRLRPGRVPPRLLSSGPGRGRGEGQDPAPRCPGAAPLPPLAAAWRGEGRRAAGQVRARRPVRARSGTGAPAAADVAEVRGRVWVARRKGSEEKRNLPGKSRTPLSSSGGGSGAPWHRRVRPGRGAPARRAHRHLRHFAPSAAPQKGRTTAPSVPCGPACCARASSVPSPRFCTAADPGAHAGSAARGAGALEVEGVLWRWAGSGARRAAGRPRPLSEFLKARGSSWGWGWWKSKPAHWCETRRLSASMGRGREKAGVSFFLLAELTRFLIFAALVPLCTRLPRSALLPTRELVRAESTRMGYSNLGSQETFQLYETWFLI